MASTEKNAALIERARTFQNVPWCEDFERMISGMLYDSMTPPLMESRMRARRLCMKYNNCVPEGSMNEVRKKREDILKELLGSVGEKAFIEPPFFVDYGCNISVGAEFFANFNTTILDCSLVTIGDRVLFGPGVNILAATHETEIQSRRDGIEFAREVSIGNDCWIGGNVSICPGVSIGKGCTIGAGAVVTKDIPDFSVAVGSPARVIKKVTPVPDT